ncbi:hypothetical protein CDEST_03743 [Colletotrichum destructivum]|uniref:Uncharacterized protein n=1 Tax=Colletotrichum destructivum TaxID=34406 RepID=A0AAX4I728_9PEZI|nr:hypothetical protein CDEST_03743 [Colletotrichum destructivum]
MIRNGEEITFGFDRPLGPMSEADRCFCWVACVLPVQASRRRKSETYRLIVPPEHVCEHVGFVEYEAVQSSNCMRFLEGYGKLDIIAVIV